MIIFNKEYTDESRLDIGEDIYNTLEKANLPKDEYGLIEGAFKVTIEWFPMKDEDNDLV